MNSNKKTLTAILILLVMCTGISISYAFFKVASSNNNANTNVTINGAALCMSLQLSSDNITISNEYAVPISDSKALSSDTYKTSVTITNNCNTSQSFNLLLVPNSSNTMPIKALKYALVEEGVTPTTGTLISNEYLLDSTIQKQLLAIKNENLNSGFSVGSGTVSSGTKTYNLYLWIDKDEGSLGNGSTMNKSLNAYLTLGSGSVIGEIKTDLYHTIENRYNQDKTYIGLYNGEGSDTYANPVYYYKGNVENNNVLFAGFCWKIVRTTETGGVKLVYNGVQKDGSCNNTGTDSQIGISAFSNDNDSLAYVGYMYNTVYPVADKSMSSQSNIVFGNSFTYSNDTYTLTSTKTVTTWSSGYNTINNNHYTCMTTGTTCSSVYYVYYVDSVYAYYITLTNGKSINDALNEMLYANDVNKNDSIIKTYIDSWYENNLASYEDKLEDTVFCNDRKLLDLGGWNPNGGSTTSYLQFKNSNTSNQSLVCANETDRFSMSNSKAKLNHPIGLISVPELSLAGYGSSHFFNNGQYVWLVSPSYFNFSIAYVMMARSGGFTNNLVSESNGVRPSVSLKPNTEFTDGDGSFTNPFVIGDAVEEPSENSFDTVFAKNNTDIFDENGLRYEGADPNNYICLDNKTSGTCSDSSLLFRIIGLFDEDTSTDETNSSGTKKLLKVIDTNNYGGTSGKYWDSNGKNNWSTASLKTELNGTYLTTLLSTSNVNSVLSSGIANAKWHLGGASKSNYSTLTAEGIYTEERNVSAIYSGNPSSIYAKVGLMYPSDYGYATVGGTTTNKSSCRALSLFDWSRSSSSDCKNNDWLYISQVTSWGSNKSEWLISPNYSVTDYATSLLLSGFVYLGYSAVLADDGTGTATVFYSRVGSDQFAVRPTFYLDSSVLKIVGGTGTSDNAYRVG